MTTNNNENKNPLISEMEVFFKLLTSIVKGSVYTWDEKIQLIKMLTSIVTFDINQKCRMLLWTANNNNNSENDEPPSKRLKL